ncbi:unnamed protein product [Cyprideis torosa]|uniref:Uncharacterized protein n=1 Tax=Cyprideis torosa TaxID=163714 RepID=A0A7R8ZJU6_9CRUS|nr:unnamed protein product [Cyprideis torosa]CAG0880394.1 unnamed protein product [Cyprideis torosa]
MMATHPPPVSASVNYITLTPSHSPSTSGVYVPHQTHVTPAPILLAPGSALAPAPSTLSYGHSTGMTSLRPQTSSTSKILPKSMVSSAPKSAPVVKKKKSPQAGSNPRPATVSRRNARERNRVKQVNMGFASLRQHLPPLGTKGNKKISKVETLRAAVEYIRDLQDILSEHEEGDIKPSPLMDTAPYTTVTSNVATSTPSYMSLKSEPMAGQGSPFDSCYTPASSTFTPLTPMSETTDIHSPTPSPPSEHPSPYGYSPGQTPLEQPSPYHNSIYIKNSVDCKVEYSESDLSVADEELLDAISWWQQSHLSSADDNSPHPVTSLESRRRPFDVHRVDIGSRANRSALHSLISRVRHGTDAKKHLLISLEETALVLLEQCRTYQ